MYMYVCSMYFMYYSSIVYNIESSQSTAFDQYFKSGAVYMGEGGMEREREEREREFGER